MQITLAHIGMRTQRGGAKAGYEALTAMYVERTQAYAAMRVEMHRTEAELGNWLTKQRGRAPVVLAVLDSRGKQLTSEGFAGWLGRQRDGGVQQVVMAVGPADGWSDDFLEKAQMVLSFGAMTMAHELARLAAAEQVYRACTILAGHPYHGGH